MAGFYEVNPANTSEIFPRDLNGVRYQDGARGLSTRYGAAPTTLGPEAAPALNIYQSTPATNPAPEPGSQYYESAILTAFSGAVKNPAARVVETFQWTRIPIEDLRAQRQTDLDNYSNLVRLSACDSSNGAGGDNWAIVTSTNNRNLIQSIDRPLSDRDADIMDILRDSLAASADFAAFKADALTWINRWPGTQEVNIRIRHKTNGSEQTYPINNATDWGTAVKDVAIFDRTTDTAYLDAEQDIRTEMSWEPLAAIVIESYPWPEFWPAA